jgi:hypothetical protein
MTALLKGGKEREGREGREGGRQALGTRVSFQDFVI